MRQISGAAKMTAMFLSAFIILSVTYSTAVSSRYITHELVTHEGHNEGYCFICLEKQLTGSLIRQLAAAGKPVILSVLVAVAACISGNRLPCYRLERNLITDKVRMDR